MKPVKYSIRDLERISGIKAHTIRMWEKRYGIILPERTSTNIRYYSDNNLRKLLNISILNRNGFKISHIAEMSEEEIVDKVAGISDSADDLDANINSMIMSAVELQEDQFEKILNSSILKLGFEKTFCDLVFPLFQKLSVFWQIGRINSCQERFMSNLIRQKLLVAIDGLVGQTSPEPKNYLLFQPSGDYNETGLLFANYLVRKSGHQVVYLGSSVPLEHIRPFTDDRQTNFDEILINLNLPRVESDLKEFLKSVEEIFPTQSIHIVHPSNIIGFKLTDYRNVHIYSSFTELSHSLAQG